MKVRTSDLRQNPNNPRKIDYFKLEELKRSIKEFPEMLEVRPIVIDKDNVIVGGNMRWQAAMELGIKEIPVLILEDEERKAEFLVKDNLSYGEWNWDGLSHDFKSNELIGWGLDVPIFYREDFTMGSTIPEDIKKDEKSKKAPTSQKKALYFFYSIDQKNKLVERIKKEKGDSTMEDWVFKKIRERIDD
jgi:hypothetical protein